MTELCQLEGRVLKWQSGSWPILDRKLTILATLFKISSSNLFCSSIYIKGAGGVFIKILSKLTL